MREEITPLAAELMRMIEIAGPLPLDRYMAMCLGHPLYGYYLNRDPFGAAGDFVTAPEITQMFGEIIGIWCMQNYELLGKPETVNLIELGPGRGTLMTDLLRAARARPDFLRSLSIRLIETSPRLRAIQEHTLSGLPPPMSWHDSLADIPQGPMLLIANEFFDALPVRQFQRTADGWSERVVGLHAGRLAIGLVPATITLPPWARAAREGELVEIRPGAEQWAIFIAERLAEAPGCALIFDYGHLHSAPGETLQAVRRHQSVPILDSPGESDLTAHVDFAALSEAMRRGGADTCLPMTQRDFLTAMGLELRASILARNATPAQKQDLVAAIERVAGQSEMGHLFKVLAATTPGLPCPHPFRSSPR